MSTPCPIHQAMARLSLQTAQSLQTIQRSNPTAYADMVLLGEIGIRAYQQMSEPHRPVRHWTATEGAQEPDWEGLVCASADHGGEPVAWPCQTAVDAGLASQPTPAVVASDERPF